MSEIVFAIPRTDYGSYQDLYKLIYLSGFKQVFIDEIDPQSDNVYVITIRNGEIPADGWRDPRARIILYDLEYRREPQAPIPGVPEVWHMDKMQAELIGAKYVPVGGHAGLRESDTPTTPVYDAAYLAYMTHRRQRIYNDLQGRGVRLSPTSAWGDDRNAVLNASRMYLHVHQHEDIPAVPGLRMVVAAAYGLPVVSERCADQGVFESYMGQIDYDQIAANIKLFLGYDEYASVVFNRQGEALHDLLCNRLTFRKSIEDAL